MITEVHQLLETVYLLMVLGLGGILCILVVIAWLLHRLRTGPKAVRRTPPKRKLSQFEYGIPVPSYASALVAGVIYELERTYPVKHNEVWDHIKDPDVNGIIYRPYIEGQEDAGLANLETEDVGIQWHRFQGNFEFCDKDWSPAEWASWYERTIHLIKNNLNN